MSVWIHLLISVPQLPRVLITSGATFVCVRTGTFPALMDLAVLVRNGVACICLDY